MRKLSKNEKEALKYLVVTPSKEVESRARKMDWHLHDEEAKFMMEAACRVGVVVKIPFRPIFYLGSTTFKKSKIRNDCFYFLEPMGPSFAGDLLKQALKVLGKKRVRLFLHVTKDEQRVWPIILGTKAGSVAVAPLIIEGPVDEMDRYYSLSSVMKSPSRRLTRRLLFATL